MIHANMAEANEMSTRQISARSRIWTATELRRLTPAERDAILTSAAAIAEKYYREDPSMTDSEAFGEDDLHAHSANDIAQTR